MIASPAIKRIAESRAVQLLFCLAVALALRAQVFGDPVFHIDETWYLLVGHRIVAGDLLYVDIWDRKPPGLFLIYALAARIGGGVISYQIMAWLCASATAFVILRMARVFAAVSASFIAATMYLALLAQMGGSGGQSPVFYNLLIAAAALLTLPRSDAEPRFGRAALAMLLCGLAITVKQTAVFEALFLGCWNAWAIWTGSGPKSGRLARIAGLALIAALPWLAVLVWYVLHGHFYDLWQAAVLSSLAKEGQIQDTLRFHRAGIAVVALVFPVGCTLAGLFFGRGDPQVKRNVPFLAGWVVAAVVGAVAVPNFYNHYFLALFVPLCVTASILFSRSGLLALMGLIGALAPLLEAKPWNFDRTARHRSSYEQLVALIRKNDPAPRLLVFDGPPLLYIDLNSRPLTPLSFPLHLYDRFERDVSRLPTRIAAQQALARQPTTVVMTRTVSAEVTNLETRALVDQYVAVNCTLSGVVQIPDWSPDDQLVVYSHCAQRQ